MLGVKEDDTSKGKNRLTLKKIKPKLLILSKYHKFPQNTDNG
jgi:hypothetical protein